MPHTSNKLTLGSTSLLFFRRPLRLEVKAAQTHWHVIGVSGSGKSRFLAGLYLEFLRTGLAGTLLDPHGDLARLVLGHLCERGYFGQKQAYEKLLYLDLPAAERRGLFLPLNVLRSPGGEDAIAANIMEAMHRAWPSLAGGAAPRFDTFIQYGIPVLLANNLPLPALPKLIADKPFRDACLEVVQDEDVKDFWQGWYDKLADRLKLEYVDSTLSRIRLLTRAPVLRYCLSQGDNVLNWRQIFDGGKSVIINLALINQDASKLLGALLMVGAEQGAISRSEAPPETRGRDHIMLVDEFPEFTAKSEEAASRILSQTRKYGLHLILAHQNWTQTSDRLRGALQNVKIDVNFALGREDAERSSKLLTRVDPKTVSHRQEADTEGVGMREQWEAMTQLLVDQLQGRATVRLPGNRKHHWQVWRTWHHRTLHIKTLRIPDPKVRRTHVETVEEEYLRRYFVPKERVDAMVRTAQPEPVPPKVRVRERR